MEPSAENLWQLAGESLDALFGGRRPATFEPRGGWLLPTGEQSPDLNCCLISDPETAHRFFERCLRRFQKLQVPFLVCLTPGALEVLEGRATQMGLIGIGDLPLMVGHNVPVTERVAEGVDVKIAQTPEDLDSYFDLASELFGIDKGALKRVLPVTALTSQSVSFYLAERDGAVCGLGATTQHNNRVGIWSMATLPELRRQGIASAVLKKMVENFPQAELFFLLATQEAQSLYLRSGFKIASTGQVFAGKFGEWR